VRGAPAPPAPLRRLSWIVTAVVAYTVATGGFVAGIRAGLAYNTFPLMNGHLVPPEMFMLEPWHLNFFNNMATVQFDHRLGAWLLALLVPWFWMKTRSEALTPRARLTVHLLLGMLALQVALGIATLLLVVPIPLAAAHQGGAVLLLTAALMANHALR
jgi:cytochrome c oxidase assembly protein subunit 15